MALAFTLFQLAWSAAWGALHVRLRKGRRYAQGREAVGAVDGFYRRLNPLLFAVQLLLSVACFWSDAQGLLEFHRSEALRLVGAALLTGSLLLMLAALRHLGESYSPCYDSHLPKVVVTSGPYSSIRHPMYLAKFLAGAGTLLLAGSLWFVPTSAYLFAVTWRAMKDEDRQLRRSLPGYAQYSRRTRLLVPHLL